MQNMDIPVIPLEVPLQYTLANSNTSFLQSEHPKNNFICLYALNQRL